MKHFSPVTWILWAVVLAFPFTGSLPVASASDRFAESTVVGDERLTLRGAGRFRYLVFDVYRAGLYLPEGISAERALDDVPKRLEVHYFRSLEKSDFTRSVHEFIRRNAGPDGYRRLLPEIREHNALYRDVTEKDSYALVYEPGRGTTLELNGNPLGTVGGAEFAAALFSIWLGEEPIDGKLKRQLLDRS